MQMKMDLDKKENELQKALNELDTMKGEFNLKMTRLKVMEMELYREKMKNQEDRESRMKS
jgi:peptidoglycan hydrolase CwlO-like protein